MRDETVRACGLAAVIMAAASVVLAPLNALARMQTESGRSDLENEFAGWWAEPALRTLGPWILDFGSPDIVYLTYGKFYAVAVAAVIACAVAARSRRPANVRWTERWGWRLTLAGFALVLLGQVAFYWILGTWWTVAGGNPDSPWGDWVYVLVLLGLLVGIPGGILLGIGLLRAGFRPRLAAWVILLDLPLSLALAEMSTMALTMWPMMLAWGLIGGSLFRGERRADPSRVEDGNTAATVTSGSAPSRLH